jgi:hypothetical protein
MAGGEHLMGSLSPGGLGGMQSAGGLFNAFTRH